MTMAESDVNSLVLDIIDCLRCVPTTNFFLARDVDYVDRRLDMLPLLALALSQTQLQQPLLDHGALSIVKRWLNPLSDKCLANRQTRTCIMERLSHVPIGFEQPYQREHLNSSGLGKVLVFTSRLVRDPRNIKAARDLVDKWRIDDDLGFPSEQPDAKKMKSEGDASGVVSIVKLMSISDMVEAGLLESPKRTTDNDESDDDDRDMNDEEEEVYYKAIDESGGFDVPDFGDDVLGFGMIKPIPMHRLEGHMELLTRYANAAIQKKCPDLKFVRILKANGQGARPFNFYITFEAEDSSAEIKAYQVKIVEGLPHEGFEVEVFREKPT